MSDNLPKSATADLKRQLSYYDSLKVRAQKNCEKKIAEYDARQDAVRARLAVLEAEMSPEAPVK